MIKKLCFQKCLFAMLLLIGSMQIQAQCTYDAYVTANSTSCGSNGLTITPEPSVIYSNDFSTGPCTCTDAGGYQLISDASYYGTPQYIQLVPDQSNKSGQIYFNTFAISMPTDWEVKFRFFMLNKSGADGFSFNLGNNSFGSNNEDGVNQGLAIRFKTFNQDKISVAWNGSELQSPTDMTIEKGIWMDVKATIIAGKISLYVNGKKITDNLVIPGYAQNNNYHMIFGGRCGGVSNGILIDDVSFANASGFEYSIDGTTYQTSNVFSNITLPTDRTLPIWIKQNFCAAKVRDFVYPSIGNNDLMRVLGNNIYTCNPDKIEFYGLPIPNQTNYEPYQDRQLSILNNLTSKNGYTIGNSAMQTSNGVLLTRDENDNHGYLIAGTPETFSPTDFEIEVEHKALNKSGADGFSINFGIPTPIINGTVSEEDGVTSGLAVRFKTNGQDNASLFLNNTQLGTTYDPSGFNLESGSAVRLGLAVSGTTVTVYINNFAIITATLPASYATTDFSAYKLIVAARTGGNTNENLFSNLKIYNLQKLQVSKDNSTFTTISATGGAGVAPFINVTPADVDIATHTVKLYYRFLNSCNYTSSIDALCKYAPAASPSPTTQVFYGNTVTGADVVIANPNANTAITQKSYRIANSVGSYLTLTPTTQLPVGIYELAYVSTWNNPVNNCYVQYFNITVEVKPLPPPTGKAIQIYAGNSPTIANLTANLTDGGSNLTWYDAATGGNVLSATSSLTDGSIYYAGQTIAGLECPRLAVTVKRIADNPITICNAPASNFTYESLNSTSTTPTALYSTEWFADNNENTNKYPSSALATSGVKYIRQIETPLQYSELTIGNGTSIATSFYLNTFQNFGYGDPFSVISDGNTIAFGKLTVFPKTTVFTQGANQAFKTKDTYWGAPSVEKTYFLSTPLPLATNPEYLLRIGTKNQSNNTFSSSPVVLKLDSNTGAVVTNILQFQFKYVGDKYYVLLADKSLRELIWDPTPLNAHTGSPILNNVEFFKLNYGTSSKFLIGEANAIKVYDNNNFTTPTVTINNTGRVIDIAQTNTGDVFAIVENSSNVVELVSYDNEGKDKIVIESPTATRNIEDFNDKVIWLKNNQLQTAVTMKRPLISNKIEVTVNLIAPFDTSVNSGNNTIAVANPTPGATYQWLECDGDDIAGATSTTFTVPFGGNFQVRVTKNGCSTTNPANCINVIYIAPSVVVLTQIGEEGDSPNMVHSVVTTTQLGLISPAITGIIAANQAAYQTYIDNNPDLFSEPATAAEVQAMVTAVNTQVAAVAASNAVLTQIGNEGDSPNTVISVVTTTQLGQILPAITGIVAGNQAAYQAFIDANPDVFSVPATRIQIQAMVDNVNAQISSAAASNAVLTQIGNEGDSPNTVTSVVTTTQLLQVVPFVTGIVATNQAAYQAYIDTNPSLFSSPATAAEVQAMVTAVNAALSINDFDAIKISIYPNPSNSIFNIEIDVNATIELYDVTGKRLRIDKIIMGTTALNLSNYSDGVYSLKITNENNQAKIVRLVKK